MLSLKLIIRCIATTNFATTSFFLLEFSLKYKSISERYLWIKYYIDILIFLIIILF